MGRIEFSPKNPAASGRFWTSAEWRRSARRRGLGGRWPNGFVRGASREAPLAGQCAEVPAGAQDGLESNDVGSGLVVPLVSCDDSLRSLATGK